MTDLQDRVLDRKYRLVRMIGEGGMGSVWEAQHTMISRRVAVKVMHAETGDVQETLGRFFREAQSASAIGHPNIVEIFDVGVEDDGTAYMVMELLNGVSLENLMLDRGTLPPARVIEITLQILSALNAAHNKGIIHRDMKPDNVFISVDSRMREEFGRVIVDALHVSQFLGAERFRVPPGDGGFPAVDPECGDAERFE